MADAWVVTGPTAVTKNGTAVTNVLRVEFLHKGVAATSVDAAYTEVSLAIHVQDTTSVSLMQNAVSLADTTAKNAYQAEIAKNYPYDIIRSKPGDTITFSAGAQTATNPLADAVTFQE